MKSGGGPASGTLRSWLERNGGGAAHEISGEMDRAVRPVGAIGQGRPSEISPRLRGETVGTARPTRMVDVPHEGLLAGLAPFNSP
jgi:hypothetical protein